MGNPEDRFIAGEAVEYAGLGHLSHCRFVARWISTARSMHGVPYLKISDAATMRTLTQPIMGEIEARNFFRYLDWTEGS